MAQLDAKFKEINQFINIWANILAVKADKYLARGDKLEAVTQVTDDGFNSGFLIKMIVKRKFNDKTQSFALGTVEYQLAPYGLGVSQIRLVSGETDNTYDEEIIATNDRNYADSNNISLLMEKFGQGEDLADEFKEVFDLPKFTKQTGEKTLYFVNRLDSDAIRCAINDYDFDQAVKDGKFNFEIRVFQKERMKRCSISLIVGIISGVSLIWIKPKTNLIPVPLIILLASLPIVYISWFFADHYDFKLD